MAGDERGIAAASSKESSNPTAASPHIRVQLDLVLLHEEVDTLGVLAEDLVLAVAHQRPVELGVIAVDGGFGGAFIVFSIMPEVRVCSGLY